MRIRARVSRVDTSKATSKAREAHKKALIATTEAARLDTERFVPFQTGALRRTASTESKPSKGLLVYGSSAVPYAKAQYYGLPGKTTPGTTMHWFVRSKAVNGPKWQRITAQEYRRHFGLGG